MRLNFGGPPTPVVRVFLWLNGLIYLFMLLTEKKMFLSTGRSYSEIATLLLGVTPQAFLQDFALWQPITYMFVHLTFSHVFFNMLGLWFFGPDLESYFGSKKFFRYYMFTGFGAGMVSVLAGIHTIGASGAIFGLLLAYAMVYPNRQIYLYGIFPVRAKYFVAFFGLLQLVFFVTEGSGSQTNHLAHLSGIAFGLLWFLLQGRHFNLAAWWRNYQKKRLRKRFRVISQKKDEDSDGDGGFPVNNKTIH